jgi:hypothetical protein
MVCTPGGGGLRDLQEWCKEASVLGGNHLPESAGDLAHLPDCGRTEKQGRQLGQQRQGELGVDDRDHLLIIGGLGWSDQR